MFLILINSLTDKPLILHEKFDSGLWKRSNKLVSKVTQFNRFISNLQVLAFPDSHCESSFLIATHYS